MICFDFLMCVNADNPYIDLAINSMLEQNYENEYGIIIVANNCTDALYDKLLSYKNKHQLITLHRTSIGQVAFNLNYGANLSNADYLVRMDADDICELNRLQLTERFILENDYPDVVSGSINLINEDGFLLKSILNEYNERSLKKIIPFKNVICHPATALKRSSLIQARGYLGGLNGEDYDLWVRMLRLNFKFILFPEVVLSYRLSSFQVRGSSIAYADGVGTKLREFLLGNGCLFLAGFFIALLKFVIFKIFRKMK